MKRFKKVYIEITNICNLKCNFCPVTDRDPKFMNIDEFGFILDEVKEFTDHIYLHVKGEPLIHPELSSFLHMANKKGLKINLTTNGTLIGQNKELLLSIPNLRQINISLHSLEQNQWFNNKEEYMDNIMDFINAAKNSDLIIALRLWNLSSEIEDNLNKNKYMLDRLEEELMLDYKIIDEFSKKRGIKIRDRLYLNEDMKFIWPNLENDIYEETGFCYGLRDQIGILVDGTVIPCCLDGDGVINLGNIFEEKLVKILDNEKAQNIYNSFSNRNAAEELCRRCGYRTKF